MTTIIEQIRDYHPYIDVDDFDRKYSLFERRVKSILFYFQKTRLLENRTPLTLQIAEKYQDPFHWIRMKKLVWMLTKNMSGSWNFEFMVKQTLLKTCSDD